MTKLKTIKLLVDRGLYDRAKDVAEELSALGHQLLAAAAMTRMAFSPRHQREVTRGRDEGRAKDCYQLVDELVDHLGTMARSVAVMQAQTVSMRASYMKLGEDEEGSVEGGDGGNGYPVAGSAGSGTGDGSCTDVPEPGEPTVIGEVDRTEPTEAADG